MTNCKTKDKGDIGLTQIIANLAQHNIKVALPISDHLPFDIIANGKMNRTIIPSEGITINSATPPQVDAKGNYLKKITLQ